MNKVYVKIDGIHCSHCESKIKAELLKIKNIKDVKISKNIAHITYMESLSNDEIIKAITDIGYITKEEYISNDLMSLDTNIKLKEFVIIFICIILIVSLIKKIFGFNIFNMIPTIDSSITYGMLIVTGILTSVHCISMCGAINLMASISTKKRNLKNPILYNVGRVLSYTLIGGLAGLIGSVLSINDMVTGAIIVFSSILMLCMSLNMLGIIKFRLPSFTKWRVKNRPNNAFLIGILNGFMPCGPLQAMQIYALSKGSFVEGAISMFLFSVGTVPLMLFVGVAINLTKGKRKILINKVASVLILILSFVMLNRGLLTLNVDLFKTFNNYDDFIPSILKDYYQEVYFDLSYDDYKDIILQKDVLARLIIHVDKEYLTGCNNEIIIKDFGIEQELSIGDNVIEFMPNKEGTFIYTCWMNMIKNNINVIDDEKYFKEEDNE